MLWHSSFIYADPLNFTSFQMSRRCLLLDIINKGLLNRVLSKHLRFIWKEVKFERFVWIEEYRATMLPNVGIVYISGVISTRVYKEYIAEDKGGWIR